MRSIQESAEKIKSNRELILLIIVVGLMSIIIGVSSFILGRLSVKTGYDGSSTLHIEYPDLVAQYETQVGENYAISGQNSNQYVASVSGTKYYTLNCSGVSRIKEENKTYFNSITEAENAGYTASVNCF